MTKKPTVKIEIDSAPAGKWKALDAIDAMESVSDRERLLVIKAKSLDRKTVQISVEDSGTGIGPEDAERIFNPLYTTKSDGMGMGLSICRSIVEADG